MPEAKQILETIINDFSIDKFSRFPHEKSWNFVARAENYSHYNDNDFKNGAKLGEINFSDSDNLIVCAFEVKKPLSERTGKKAQYDKATAISKAEQLIKTLEGTKLIETKGKNIKPLRENLEKLQKTIEIFLKTLKK